MQHILVALWMVTAASAVSAQALDRREATYRNPAERAFVLSQMRLFLTSIQGITTALATGDAAGVAAAALASGRRAGADTPKPATLASRETPAWHNMILSMRDGFDAAAAAASSGAPPQRVLAIVGQTMTTCIACHAMYRLSETPR